MEGRVVLVLNETQLIHQGIVPVENIINNEIPSARVSPAVMPLAAVQDSAIDIVPVPGGIRLTIRDIHFVPDSAEFLPEETHRLNIIAETLNQMPNRGFLVEGHTASVGRPVGEMELSIERARRLVDEMVLRGISENRFIYRGWGGTMPIDDNSTAAGRSNNRRVEITILE